MENDVFSSVISKEILDVDDVDSLNDKADNQVSDLHFLGRVEEKYVSH